MSSLLLSTADDLQDTTIILLTNTDVEVDSKPHAKRIEVRVTLLDGRSALALQEANLECVNLAY